VRITQELLERKSRGCGLENGDKRPKGFAALTTQHPLPGKVDTTSPAAAVDYTV
jgi:hypothetical protein